jgi:hypothetical protein
MVIIAAAFTAFRILTAAGCALLASRQRMWLCALVGLVLLGFETFVLVRVATSGVSDLSWVAPGYAVMLLAALGAWLVGVRFRDRQGDSALRREASELPLLHASLVVVQGTLSLSMFLLA